MRSKKLLLMASGITLAIVCMLALFSLPGCGVLNPDYEPTIEAYKKDMEASKVAIEMAQREVSATKAQIIASQTAEVAVQTRLDLALANFARVQQTPAVPPEVVSAHRDLVDVLQREAAASKAAVADALQARETQLEVIHAHDQRRKDITMEMREYQLKSAVDTAQQGTGILSSQAMPGWLGVLGAIGAFLAARTGKSRSEPAIAANAKAVETNEKAVEAQRRDSGELWDRYIAQEKELGELRGRLGLPPSPPISHPVV